MSQEQTLDISWEAILKVFIAIFIFYIIYLAREIALWFLFALAISILLDPAIKPFKKIHVPRIIAIIIVYLSIFGILGVLIYLSAPIFVSEIRLFIQNLPSYFEQVNPILRQFGISTAQNFNDFTGSATSSLQQSSQGIIKALMIFFGGIASTLSILTMAFFLSLEENGVEKVLLLLSPAKYEEQIKTIFERVQKKVAGWFGARFLACLFVGIASYIVFFIFGVQYAFILALLSGFLNFIPYIGPWIISILLLFLSPFLRDHGCWLFMLLIPIIIIQEIENKLVNSAFNEKNDQHPVRCWFWCHCFLGAKIFGFLGMIFAVPVFGIIYEFTKEFLEKRRGMAEFN